MPGLVCVRVCVWVNDVPASSRRMHTNRHAADRGPTTGLHSSLSQSCVGASSERIDDMTANFARPPWSLIAMAVALTLALSVWPVFAMRGNSNHHHHHHHGGGNGGGDEVDHGHGHSHTPESPPIGGNPAHPAHPDGQATDDSGNGAGGHRWRNESVYTSRILLQAYNA